MEQIFFADEFKLLSLKGMKKTENITGKVHR